MGSIFGRPMATELTSKAIQPIIFINGCTGTGKSDLAIALAQRFSGEVINADAMQLYKGLDIVTNKVTEEEMAGIPHHMMNILEPTNLSYTIHEYKNRTRAVIDYIRSRQKTPIVVGGTNYYIDSLIWESLIPKHENQESSSRFEPDNHTPSEVTLSYMKRESCEDEFNQIPTDEFDNTSVIDAVQTLDTNYLRLHCDNVDSPKLHRLLMMVDPDTAITIHPNTVRKIIRAIEVFKHHGRTQSSFLSEMNSKADKQMFGAKLCYKNSIVLWLQCELDVLDERLDSRVDCMIKRGLINELDTFHHTFNEKILTNTPGTNHANYTRGIFQCIGFKEFHSYLHLSPKERETKNGADLFEQGVEDVKAATRRYAKYQSKWIRKRIFEQRNPDHVPPVYTFDSTEKEKFNENVVNPAISLIEQFVGGQTPTKEQFKLEAKTQDDNPVVYMTCEICDVLCVRKVEWDNHITSRRHHKRMASHRLKERQRELAYKTLSDTLTQHETNLGCSERSHKTELDDNK